MSSKVCLKCGIEKPLELFSNRKDSKDGKRNQCKDCRSQHKKQFYIDNKESIQAYKTQYAIKNKEYIQDNKAQYYIDNRETILKRVARYHVNNPDISRKCSHNQRARRKDWGEVQSINNWFKGSELHHLHVNDHTTCIYVPIGLHNSISHAWNKPKKMNEINKLITEWYLNINIKEI